jgi:hypothetical protein
MLGGGECFLDEKTDVRGIQLKENAGYWGRVSNSVRDRNASAKRGSFREGKKTRIVGIPNANDWSSRNQVVILNRDILTKQ